MLTMFWNQNSYGFVTIEEFLGSLIYNPDHLDNEIFPYAWGIQSTLKTNYGVFWQKRRAEKRMGIQLGITVVNATGGEMKF